MGHIQRQHLSNALVVIPNVELLEIFDEIFTPLLDMEIDTRLESRTLAQTRDALLPKLMSGEVRVGEMYNE